MRGYFGIGIYQPKEKENIGTLMRSAYQLGASFVFTIGRRYKREATDTMATGRHIPIYNFVSMEHFKQTMPEEAELVFVDFGTKVVPLDKYVHPQQAVYILGSEDHGFDEEVIKGETLLAIPSVNQASYNVAVAGSIVMYDRLAKAIS